MARLQQALANQRPVELKRDDNGTTTISGYGAVFYNEADAGTEYQIYDGMRERIMPGAFRRALEEDDVRSMFNHDPNQLLGRVKNGTLRLFEDLTGLRYEVDLPDTQVGRDVAASIERGDVDGSSFWFSVDDKIIRADDTNGGKVMEVHSVTLREVGPVVFPAYEATTAATRKRAVDEIQSEIEAEEQAKQAQIDQDVAESTIFLLTVDDESQ